MFKLQLLSRRIFFRVSFCCVLLSFVYLWSIPIVAQTYPDENDPFRSLYPNLNQQITDLFLRGKNRFRSSVLPVYLRCGTPLVQIARQHPEFLEKSNHFVLYRPSDSSDSYYYGTDIDVWSYDSHLMENSNEEGHFRLYYTEDNLYGDAVRNADGLQSTIPDFVIQFAGYFEQAWSYLIDTLGYDEPIANNEKIEIFILNISCYGITSSDNRGTYVLVNNDYQWVKENLDSEGKESGAMKVTAVHEFFHVVQAGYDNWPNDNTDENRWWEENTATWIEDELYDEVNDYLHYLGWPYIDDNNNGQWDDGYWFYGIYYPAEIYYDIWQNPVSDKQRSKGWFDYPHISLDKTSYDWDCPYSRFEYGGVIWIKYLAEKYSPEIIRTIFEGQKNGGESALSSIQTILTLEGSGLKSDMEEFKQKILERDFEEGENYPLVRHLTGFELYPAQFYSDTFYDNKHGGYIGNLDHLAAHYLRYQAPEEDGTIGNISFSFSKTNGPAELSCLLMLKTQSGLWERKDIPLQSSSFSGEINITGFGHRAEYQEIVAIPLNVSTTYFEDDASFVIEAFFEPKPYHEISFRQGMNLFTPAIPENQTLDSHQFLLHHFPPNSVYSFYAYDKQTSQWIKNSHWEVSDFSSISGSPFNLTYGDIYILYLTSPFSIILESSTTQTPRPLSRGVNFLSYSPQMFDETISDVFTLLHDLDEKASAIRKNHDKSGKWKMGYPFFQKKAGENFPITSGETYMVEMFQEEI